MNENLESALSTSSLSSSQNNNGDDYFLFMSMLLCMISALLLSLLYLFPLQENDTFSSTFMTPPLSKNGSNNHQHHHQRQQERILLLTRERLDPICRRQWKTVLSWVAFHPDEVAVGIDKYGQNVLHHACLFGAPVHVIESILHAAPELASGQNVDGEVALHWAVRLSLPNLVLKLLLKADPTSAFVKQKTGMTPLSILWERYHRRLLQTWREDPKGGERLRNDHAWKLLLAVFKEVSILSSCDSICDNGNCDENDNDNDSGHSKIFYPLHAAAACPCPPALFPLMIQVYKDSVYQVDGNYQLPLSIAASNPIANRSCDVHTKIQQLLQEYPEGVAHVDSLGRLPLHHAAAAGVRWEEGLEDLFKMYPQSLAQLDPVTELYPFALAAAATTTTTTTTTSAPSNLLPKQEGEIMLDGDATTVTSTRTEEVALPADDNVAIRHQAPQYYELTNIYNLLRADPSVLK